MQKKRRRKELKAKTVKYPQLQFHASKRFRTKDGKFLSKNKVGDKPLFKVVKKLKFDKLEAFTNNSNKVGSMILCKPEKCLPVVKIKKCNKYKTTLGVKPLFKVRRNYRQYLTQSNLHN